MTGVSNASGARRPRAFPKLGHGGGHGPARGVEEASSDTADAPTLGRLAPQVEVCLEGVAAIGLEISGRAQQQRVDPGVGGVLLAAHHAVSGSAIN